jgi:hypothetical protein
MDALLKICGENNLIEKQKVKNVKIGNKPVNSEKEIKEALQNE